MQVTPSYEYLPPETRVEHVKDQACDSGLVEFRLAIKPVAVLRSVEHHRRDHARHAQRGNQRRGFAMTLRVADPQTLASGAAAKAAGYAGRGPRLVNEHQPFRVQVDLTVEPVVPLVRDVWPVLLAGMASILLRVIPWRTMKRWSPDTETVSPISMNAKVTPSARCPCVPPRPRGFRPLAP